MRTGLKIAAARFNPSALLLRLRIDDRGASLIEYGLVVVLIAIVALVAVELVGQEVSGMYSEIGSGLVDAGS